MWPFGGTKKPDPPARGDPRRPSATVSSSNTHAPAITSLPTSGAGQYESPKVPGFGFIAPAAAAPQSDSFAPVSAAPAASGFSFVGSGSVPINTTPPQSGFSFTSAPAVDSVTAVPPSPGGGFSFMSAAPAPASEVLGGLSFSAPTPAPPPAPEAPISLFGGATDGAPVPLFNSALKAGPVKKKRAAKKPGFAREDDPGEAPPDDNSSIAKSDPLAEEASRHRSVSEVSEATNFTHTSAQGLELGANSLLDGMKFNRANDDLPPPSSLLAGLQLKQTSPPPPSIPFGDNIPAPSQPSLLAGLSIKQAPVVDATPAVPFTNSLLSGLNIRAPTPEEVTPEPPVVRSPTPSPPPREPSPEPYIPPAPAPVIAPPPSASAPVVAPPPPPPPAPAPAPPPAPVSEEEAFMSVIGSVDTVARQCKMRLFDLKLKKQSVINAESEAVKTIGTLRSSIRKAEGDQNAAIEVEDFATAESLDSMIADWRAQLDAAERKQASLEVELQQVDKNIDDEFQKGFGAVSDTVIRLQSHVDLRKAALSTFSTDSSKKSRLAGDRIANEEEQLRLKQEHVDLDEKLVMEEQMQVEAAIQSQTAENQATVTQLSEKHAALTLEIQQLELLLKQKREEEVATAQQLAEFQGKVSTIRAKFSKQLDRLRTKRELVDSEKRECSAEADAIAKARRELEDKQQSDADRIAKSTSHIATAQAEASLTSQLRECLVAVSSKRRSRNGSGSSDGNATGVLLKLKSTLDGSLAQLKSLSRRRSELDAVVTHCRDAIAAIDGKLPALNEEKKAVVAARKFKEAAKVQADIKQLSEEKVEEEAKLGETVRAIDSCDSELEQLKSSIEIHRSKISTLEAEADAEKMRDLRATIVDIRRRLRKLKNIPGRLIESSASGYSAAAVLLEAESDLAMDELRALCGKHGESQDVPPETDSEDEASLLQKSPVKDSGPIFAAPAAPASPLPSSMGAAVSAQGTPVVKSPTVTEEPSVVCVPVVPVVEPELVALEEEPPVAIAPARTASEIADEIASIKASVTQLESAVEAAIASEDFDQADALQGDIDAKNLRLVSLEADLEAAQ